MPSLALLTTRVAAFAALALLIPACGAGSAISGCASDSDCGTGYTCQYGACGLPPSIACSMGESACSGVCVKLSNDSANCGSCGHVCDSGLACANGTCQPPCALGLTLCGSSCVNNTNDSLNCGSCGNACPKAQIARRALVFAPSVKAVVAENVWPLRATYSIVERAATRAWEGRLFARLARVSPPARLRIPHAAVLASIIR